MLLLMLLLLLSHCGQQESAIGLLTGRRSCRMPAVSEGQLVQTRGRGRRANPQMLDRPSKALKTLRGFA